MERNAQLDAPGRSFARTAVKLSLTAALTLCIHSAAAQCSAGPDSPIEHAYAQQQWDKTVRLAEAASTRTAEEEYDYGLALAHLGRWDAAHSALLAGHRACPGEARFDVELAGTAFQQKQYPAAAAWLRRTQKLDAHDNYTNDFAGSVYFLMGNTEAALKNWNRVSRPTIAALRMDPHLKTRRLLLERSFVFAPQSMLRLSDYEATEARLHALGVFPNFQLHLAAREPGTFDAEFYARERNGFGATRTQALLSTFSGIFYETIYPGYFNLHGEAMNVESLLRWDTQKRRAWLSVSSPWHLLPQWRWSFAADLRNENWSIRRSFTGTAPVLGSLNLQRQMVSAELRSIHSGRFQWTADTEVSHREYRSVDYGTAFNEKMLSAGMELKQTAAATADLLFPEHRLRWTSQGAAEFARIWADTPHSFMKLQGASTLHWLPQATGERFELQERVRAGASVGDLPFDDLYLLGMERDTDLWLRGHIATRDGRKGSAPLGDCFLLSNTDVARTVYSNGIFRIQAGPLLDAARTHAANSSLAPQEWLIDTGAEVKLTVLGTSVAISYGRDLRTGANAVFATVLRRQP